MRSEHPLLDILNFSLEEIDSLPRGVYSTRLEAPSRADIMAIIDAHMSHEWHATSKSYYMILGFAWSFPLEGQKAYDIEIAVTKKAEE